jgi:hypothetical protein
VSTEAALVSKSKGTALIRGPAKELGAGKEWKEWKEWTFGGLSRERGSRVRSVEWQGVVV